MALHVIKKGLDLPITGEPGTVLENKTSPAHVALVAADYIGLKPKMLVKEGDTVKRGQVLFEDKKNPGVLLTAPGAGTVSAINRGERRALQSVVIALNDAEKSGKAGKEDFAAFESYTGKDPFLLNNTEIRDLMIESGMWTALRVRPFSKVAAINETPHSIFVNMMDSNPLAPSVDAIVSGREADMNIGLYALSQLTPGRVYFCKSPKSKVRPPSSSSVVVEEFSGPHPSGTVGLHIHTLDPVSRHKKVWHIGYQDVLALGYLLKTGQLDIHRTISLAGPSVKNPRLLRVRIGASLEYVVENELQDGEQRVISGSVLSGRASSGAIHGYLGRYHNQITALREGRDREFFGWLSPGLNKFSVTSVYLSKLMPEMKFPFTTNTNGSHRAMVPIGSYEKVMPMDILPTFLLRSLIVNDLEQAEALGCLELDEEDLALCTFVCPGKYEYGPMLRRNLEMIEKEG